MSTSPLQPPAGEWAITADVPGPLRALADIWTYRRLAYYLAVRTVQRMYRRTVLGWLWLFIIPLFPIALRTIVFGGLLGVTSDGIPYFLFLTVGQLMWDLFAVGLTWASRGLELHTGAQDVYVPRIIMPLASMGRAFVDLGIKAGLLAAVAVFFWLRDGRSYIVFGPPLLLVPAALLLTVLFAMGISFFTSVWSEQARDTRFVLAQVLSLWYLMTPILYPTSAVPESWRPWLILNPLAAFIEAFKYGLLGVGQLDPRMFASSVAVTLVIFAAGLQYFVSHEVAASDAR